MWHERQKSASVPRQWDESACLRGATHVRRDISSHPLCSCYGERAVDVSIPAGRAVFPGFRSVGRFQPGASFSVRRMAWYSCSVIAVFVTAYSTIVSQIGPNVNRLRPKTGKFKGSHSIKIQQGCSGRNFITAQRLRAASSSQAAYHSARRKRQASFTPLLVLSPHDPLRWARAGAPCGIEIANELQKLTSLGG